MLVSIGMTGGRMARNTAVRQILMNYNEADCIFYLPFILFFTIDNKISILDTYFLTLRWGGGG